MSKDDRRAFVRAENLVLGRFLDVPDLVGWRRAYRCDCGFTCHAPGEIHDHVQTCRGKKAEAGA